MISIDPVKDTIFEVYLNDRSEGYGKVAGVPVSKDLLEKRA